MALVSSQHKAEAAFFVNCTRSVMSYTIEMASSSRQYLCSSLNESSESDNNSLTRHHPVYLGSASSSGTICSDDDDENLFRSQDNGVILIQKIYMFHPMFSLFSSSKTQCFNGKFRESLGIFFSSFR